MAFDILRYYNDHKGYYGDMPLEDVARDAFKRGFHQGEQDYETWKQNSGIAPIIDEDFKQRQPPTFDDKLREATMSVAPKTEGGLVKSFLQGGAEGVTTELPSMVGGALQFVGSHLPFKGIEKAGKSLKDWAEEKRQELYGPEIERTGLDRIVYEGTKMLAPSLIPGGIVGTVARGAKGVNALLKAGKAAEATAAAKSATNIAGGSVAALFGLSQAQQTKDTAEQAGVDPGLAPYMTGAIEAAGEFLGTKYLAKLFRLDEAEVIKRGTKEFVKDLIKTIGVEVGTELGQQGLEAGVEKYTGIRPGANPVLEAIDVIGPTTFMTILTGGLAGAANKLRSQNPEEKDAAQYIEKLKAGAMFSMAINEGLTTGQYEGTPFTSDHAIEVIKEAQNKGVFDDTDIDRFKDKYPQLRDGLNGVIAENLTKKIDEAVTNTLTNEVTNTAQNLSDVPIEPEGREEELPPETAVKVKKLQNQITKQEDYLTRNANRKGETQYEKWAADLEQKKTTLAELTKPAEEAQPLTPTAPSTIESPEVKGAEKVQPAANAEGEKIVFHDKITPYEVSQKRGDAYSKAEAIENKNKPIITELQKEKSALPKGDRSGRKAAIDKQIKDLKEEAGAAYEAAELDFQSATDEYAQKIIERAKEEGISADDDTIYETISNLSDGRMHDHGGPDTWNAPLDDQVIEYLKEEQEATKPDERPAPLSQTDAATVGKQEVKEGESVKSNLPAPDLEKQVAGAPEASRGGQQTKEPWQMTREDVRKTPALYGDSIAWRNLSKSLVAGEPLTNVHKSMVQQALSEGKPVPPEVLKDYPELKKKETAPKKPELKRVLDVYGRYHYIDTNELTTDRKILKRYNSNGERPLDDTGLHRGNIVDENDAAAVEKAKKTARLRSLENKAQKKILSPEELEEAKKLHQEIFKEATHEKKTETLLKKKEVSPQKETIHKTFKDYSQALGYEYPDSVAKAKSPLAEFQKINEKKLKENGINSKQLIQKFRTDKGKVTTLPEAAPVKEPEETVKPVEPETKVIPATAKAEKTVTTPKEQKAYVVDKAEGLLADARKRFKDENKSEAAGASYDSWSEQEVDDFLYKRTSNYPVIDDGSESIIIDVPNDGRYKIPNKYEAFSNFYKNIRKMSTSTGQEKQTKKSLPKPTGKPISQIEKEAFDEYMNAYYKYRQNDNLKMSNELKESIKEDYPKEYAKIVKEEAEQRQHLLDGYKEYTDTKVEETEIDKWKKIIQDVDDKKITLKSLSEEFGGKTPSYKDVQEKLGNANEELSRKEKWANDIKERIKNLYPDDYKDISGERKVAAKAENKESTTADSGEELTPADDTEYTPAENLIHRDVAMRSHHGTSFDPEKRGQQEIEGFYQELTDIYDKLKGQAKSEEAKKMLVSEMRTLERNLASKKNGLLQAHSGLYSSMIAGPANFPVRRMEKKNAAYDNKVNEYLEFKKKAVKAISKKLTELTTQEAGGETEVLKKKIADLEKLQDTMKQTNAVIRKNISDAEKIELLKPIVGEKHAAELLKPDVLGRKGFAQYQLTNNLASIKRNKERLAELENRDERENKEIAFDGGYVAKNSNDDRIQIFYNTKPSPEIISQLKSKGFHWSPSNKAWQRQWTKAAEYETSNLIGKDINKTDKGVEMYSVKSKDFSSRVDDFVSGKIMPGNVIDVLDTPPVLQSLGVDNLPIIMTYNTMEKAIDRKHGLTPDMIKQLPEQIADPIMIFDSATHADSLVVMTELKQDGKTIVAAISLSKEAGNNVINDIVSVHPRTSEYHFINWINQGLLRYQNRQKSREWFRSRGLRLPKEETATRDFKNKILFETDIVKGKYSTINSTGPFQLPTLSEVQDIFKGQNVTQMGEGFAIDLSNGKGVLIKAVDQITPDRMAINIGYGKAQLSENEVIAGKYQNGKIELVKGAADKFTLSHESVHFMEDIGVINDNEVKLLQRHIKNLASEGKWDTLNKEDIGGAEDRAEFLAQSLQKEPKGLLGRIINKIQDFIDKLVNLFSRTVRGITRDIKTGEIYGKETEEQREARLDLEGGGVERSLADLYKQEKEIKYSVKKGTGEQEYSTDVNWWKDRDINAELKALPKKYWQGNVRDFIKEGYIPITRNEADELYKNNLDEFVSWVMLKGQETTGLEGLFMKPLTYQGYEPYYYEKERHFKNAEAFGLYRKFRSRYLQGREREIAQQTGRDTSPISEEAPLQKVAESDTQYSMTPKKGTAVITNENIPLSNAEKALKDVLIEWMKNRGYPPKLFLEYKNRFPDIETWPEFKKLNSAPYWTGWKRKGIEEEFHAKVLHDYEIKNYKLSKENPEYNNVTLLKELDGLLSLHEGFLKEIEETGVWGKTGPLGSLLGDEGTPPVDLEPIPTTPGLLNAINNNSALRERYLQYKEKLKNLTGNEAPNLPNPSRPPEVGGQYQLRKQTDPPVSRDPKILNTYLKDETDAIVQTIINKLHPKSMTWLETMLKSPEWFDHPQIQNIVKLFMRDRNELYHETFNELNASGDSTVTEIAKALRNKGLTFKERISGKVSPEYQTLMDMIDDGDTRWVRNTKVPLETQLKHFEDAWRKKGATDEIINVWRSFRQSYDKALDLMTKQLRDMIEEIKQEAIQKGEKPDLSELRQTLKGALAQMEEWRGFYAPRQRQGNWAVQAYKEHGPLEQNREWHRAHKESEWQARSEAKRLEREGWTVYKVGEVEKLPEDIYQNVRAVSAAKLIDAALDKYAQKSDVADIPKLNEEVLREVSNMIKSRGFRATMIHRGRGNVVRGFIEDPIERHLVYINSVSGGISKAKVARMAINELLGDRAMGQQIGGIDPMKDPKAFAVAQDYIQEQLRNADQADRIIGLAKSIATFKFLGFNLRSLAVNMTAIMTTAPAAIHQYVTDGKGSMTHVLREITKAGGDYAKVMTGKKLANADEQAFIDEQHRKGWDDAQYTREALGEISKLQSKAWSYAMDASMWAFGKSEQWNRGTTMLAAYRIARKQGLNHAEAAERAKNSSDKAHGVYGKSTMPMWAQGTNPAAKIGQMMYVYSKFGHNYIQMLYDLGFKKHNIKGAMFAFLSPLVLAGGAALPFKDVIFAFAGVILRSLFGKDKDPEKWVWDIIREHLGADAERIGRHGLTGAAGIDISGSLSIGIGIPKNFIDLTGAIGGVFTEGKEAVENIGRGNFGKAAEHLLPSGFANPVRALRENQEGVTTRNNRRVWDEQGKPYIPGTGASVARGFGFRSTDQAVLSERTWEGHRQQSNFADKRNKIYERYRAWLLGGRDREEYKKIVKEVQDFNRYIRENRIRGESYITAQSLRNQARRMMRPSKKERAILQE